MKLVEVGWLLNESAGTKYGLRFLQAVYNSENVGLYDTDTIKITVEFLYLKYSRRIQSFLFPIYAFTVLFFLATLFYFELVEDERDYAEANKNKRDKKNKLKILPGDPRLDPDYGRSWMMLIGSLNMLMTLINIGIVVLKTYITRETYWNSQWGPLDTAFCIFNFIVVVMILNF